MSNFRDAEEEMKSRIESGALVYHDVDGEDVTNNNEIVRFEGEEEPPSHPLARGFGGPRMKTLLYFLLFVGVVAYTIAAVSIDLDEGVPVLCIELFFMVCFVGSYFANLTAITSFMTNLKETAESIDQRTTQKIYLAIMVIAIVTGMIISRDDLSRLFGFVGVFSIILLSYLFSWKRSKVQWRPVVWGFTLQFIFGLLILKTQAGEEVFKFLGDQISVLQKYTNEGVKFVFAPLDEGSPFALGVLPVIILYSGLTAVFFHLGLLQKVTQAVGQAMMFTMGTSAPESLNAAGNIFLGQTESPLLIRPYLKSMTHSEIHAVMTGGFATIAGSVLVAFTSAGVPAEHLISASVMSAPAALAISKIVYPETIKVDDSTIKDMKIGEQYTNVLEAFSRGASMSISLIANIIANLIAFLALIAFLNEIVRYFFSKVGVDDIDFEELVGYAFSPFAFLIGIPYEDCGFAGELLGIKTVANEFVAFLTLAESDLDKDGKTFLIMTYALCGFANFSSIGIQLGSLGAMAPSKLPVMSSLAFSAMICGNLACFMTACIASVLIG